MVRQKIRISLLGGTGYVGQALLRELSTWPDGSVQVKALVRGERGRLNWPFVQEILGELPAVSEELFFRAPHLVIHFGVQKKDSAGRGFLEVNVEGTKNVIRKMPSSSLGIMYGSSLSVYGQGSQEGIGEDNSLKPQTPLAKSRVLAERCILQAMSRQKKHAISLRPRYIVGITDRSTIPLLIKIGQQGWFYGTGKQIYSFIEVQDYAKIIGELVHKIFSADDEEKPLLTPLNIGYSRGVQLEEILKIICQNLKLPIPRGRRFSPWYPQILRFLPGKKKNRKATLMELVGFSHHGDVSQLETIIGTEVTRKDPLDVLDDVIKNHYFFQEEPIC